MPYVAPPFPPRVPFVAPSDLSWSLGPNSCNDTDLDCRARANSARTTIANRANAEEAKYNQDKAKYELRWSGNRTAQGMPIAAGYESQYDSRGLYIGPNSPAVSATTAGVTVAVQDARATRMAGLISGAAAGGQCVSAIANIEITNSAECKSYRSTFAANKKKGMNNDQAHRATINPPTPTNEGTKLAKALDEHKKATDAVKKPPAKPKPNTKPKPKSMPKPKPSERRGRK